MPGGYANDERGVDIKQIQTTFADVQDDTYPAAEHLAPMDQVRARFRDKGFVRHQLQGLNVFLLEMFNRFMEPDTSPPPNYSNDILGVRKSDYMSTLTTTCRTRFELRADRAAGDGDDRGAAAEDQQPDADRGRARHQHDRPPLAERRRIPPRLHRVRRHGQRPDRSRDRAAAVVWASGRTNAGRAHRRWPGQPACRPNTSAPQPTVVAPTSRTSTAAGVPSPTDAGADLRGADQGRRRQLHDQLSPPRQNDQGQPAAAERLDRDRARSSVVHRRVPALDVSRRRGRKGPELHGWQRHERGAL